VAQSVNVWCLTFDMTTLARLAILPAIMSGPIALAQINNTRFEVASIKRCVDGKFPPGISAGSPGRLTVNCTTVMNLINQSYVLYAKGTLDLLGERLVPVEKGPSWINSERYTIEAKAEGSSVPSSGMMRGPMLQSLLEERFKLKIRSETRDGRVYFLTVARTGASRSSALQKSGPESCTPLDFDHSPRPNPGQSISICKMARITTDVFEMRGVTIAEFGVELSRRLLDRNVIDKTGIAGPFDIRVPLTPGFAETLVPLAPPPSGGTAATPPNSPDTSDRFAAAQSVVQKLGLKLESAKGPSRVLVIDHVERPSEN
jgi:uncharacterized protein (TIGR03435 family)